MSFLVYQVIKGFAGYLRNRSSIWSVCLKESENMQSIP